MTPHVPPCAGPAGGQTPYRSPEVVLRRFAERSLPVEEWTHEAHLAVCWYATTLLGAARATDHLRDAIRAFNEATGVANTDHTGYHETLTRYFVAAVAASGADHPGALVDRPGCSRSAPFAHWSRGLLFTPAARLGWVEPDLAPLPWAVSDGAWWR